MINEMNAAQIVNEAIRAGHLAHNGATPTPMVVGTAKSPFSDEIDRSKPTYFVSEGVCGFAWVSVYGVKLNTKLGKALKTLGFRKSYTGGLQYWVSTCTQSLHRKEAFAEAMAKVLRDNGLTAYADSRMD